MPRTPLQERLRLLTVPDTLPRFTPALTSTALRKARAFLAHTPVPHAAKAAAQQKAAAAVRQARASAVAGRSATITVQLASRRQAGLAARTRLLAPWASGAMRTPSRVIVEFLARSVPDPRRLARAHRASLLIRSTHADADSFIVTLAQVLGLRNAAEVTARHIVVRQVEPRGDGEVAVYSVRLPVRRSDVQTEIHNLAWALRKSGRFRSVRPDGGRKLLLAGTQTHAKSAKRDFAWPLVLTRALEAQNLPPRPTGAARGEGIVIAHPDTGWAPHPQLDRARLDIAGSFNAATGARGGAAARHSLTQPFVLTLTHGTATASVMVGGEPHVGKPESDLPAGDLVLPTMPDGGRDYFSLLSAPVVDSRGSLAGVAPRAKVRPIKFIDDVPLDVDRTGVNGAGVARFCDEDLVTAIEYARTSGAHVISLSIGGFMDDTVRVAIDRAVEDDGLIVVAAAGQTYTGPALNRFVDWAAFGNGGDTVILPAAYSNVIAVAGCSQDGFPWDESLRGRNIDITAPADAMWVADYAAGPLRTPVLTAAAGTSFAAAFVAGAAALWLGHWGRTHLVSKYDGVPLAWVFRHQLQRTARARHAGWDSTLYGPGIIDVLALLQEPLPAPSDVKRPPATTPNLVTMVSATLDDPSALAVGDAWALLYDAVGHTAELSAAFGDAVGMTAEVIAETLVAAGAQALADLHSFADTVGDGVQQATRDAIAATNGLITEAAALAEAAARAAAESADDAVDAVTEVAEEVVQVVGEAAEDAVEFLFGWLND